MKTIICHFCPEPVDQQDPESWAGHPCCDKCWDKFMLAEDIDYDIYLEQKGKCFICQKELRTWTIEEIEKTKRAICGGCATIKE